jgi:hypothetical protein
MTTQRKSFCVAIVAIAEKPLLALRPRRGTTLKTLCEFLCELYVSVVLPAVASHLIREWAGGHWLLDTDY